MHSRPSGISSDRKGQGVVIDNDPLPQGSSGGTRRQRLVSDDWANRPPPLQYEGAPRPQTPFPHSQSGRGFGSSWQEAGARNLLGQFARVAHTEMSQAPTSGQPQTRLGPATPSAYGGFNSGWAGSQRGPFHASAPQSHDARATADNYANQESNNLQIFSGITAFDELGRRNSMYNQSHIDAAIDISLNNTPCTQTLVKVAMEQSQAFPNTPSVSSLFSRLDSGRAGSQRTQPHSSALSSRYTRPTTSHGASNELNKLLIPNGIPVFDESGRSNSMYKQSHIDAVDITLHNPPNAQVLARVESEQSQGFPRNRYTPSKSTPSEFKPLFDEKGRITRPLPKPADPQILRQLQEDRLAYRTQIGTSNN
jgi:hypothetical protein